jgi:diguanylate cyclase (GGDEF)-like protein/PAS domain S-box-containing protein
VLKKKVRDMSYLKKLVIALLLVIVITIPVVSVNVKADASEERTIYLSATEFDYPPFSVTDSGEADGFSVELLKAVAEEMGIVVTFKIDQWNVLKEELKNGELDILPLVGYTEERDEIYDFTVPYIVMRGNIFVRKGENGIQSQEDLFGKEILVLDGDNSQEWAWSIGLDSELTATATYLEAFELLASGVYDAVLAQGLVGEKLISDHGLDNITPVYVYDDNGINRYKLNLEGYEQKFCFAVVEGDSELLSILNEGLSIVSTNGTYDELYQKWFPFLLEYEGVSTAEVLKYVGYVLIPILVLLITAYFITTRKTIKNKTEEIVKEKNIAEKYLHDLILSGKIFETSIEHAPIPIMIHADDGQVINISKTWTKLTGYQKEDIPTIYEWTEKAFGTKKEDVQRFISGLYILTETQHDGEFEVNTKDDKKLIWDFYSIGIGQLTDGRKAAMSVATDITERVEISQLLKESEERFKALHNASFGGISIHDKGLILDCNQGLADMTGYSQNELIGSDGVMLIAPDYRDFVMNKITSSYEKPYEAYGLRKNGDIYPLRLEARKIPYKGKQVRVVEFRDITEQKKVEEELLVKQKELQHSKYLMNYIIEHNNAGVAVHDKELNYVYVSNKYLDQYDIHDDIIGKHHHDVFPDLPDKWREIHQKTLQGMVFKNDKDLFVRNDGILLWTRWECRPWYDANDEIAGIIIYTEVINELVKAEQEKEYLLTHDQLTGLNTRIYFDEQIKQIDKDENLPISLINFDINGLIIINEAFGHEYGDEFIKFIAQTLKDVFNDESVISRVGGDQFTVLLKNTSNKTAENLAKEVAARVKNQDIKGTQISIAHGIATKNKDEEISKLFTISENNMYSNKIFESQSYRNNSIKSMIKAYHEKNPREEEHSKRVSILCEKFAEVLEMNYEDINKLKAISHLHDIGKIAIDEAILNKPGKLNDVEWETIKKHPEIGARIISTSHEYSVIADDILSHHERYDGNGYPRGIAGKDIPIRARMIAIIDSYDAMTSDRPYRKAMAKQEAIDEIVRCSGTQFDPDLVEVFIKKVIINDDADITS